MTAVEWLIDELKDNGIEYLDLAYEIIEQAKEMEKQQIIKAHGVKRTRGERQGISFWESKTGEQYYNKTYKNEQI
jgi:hypothetical protein